MKTFSKLFCLSVLLAFNACGKKTEDISEKSEVVQEIHKPHYIQNKAPLIGKAYLDLPLGAIEPHGWLKDQLERMKNGMTGHLDEIYPEVVGERNGWLGGDGDGWERGPYWIDGLLPLAYILDDEDLKAKVQPWIEWTLDNQYENGYLGPIPFDTPPKHEEGLQRGQRMDWWPKMVMLKILSQYYDATQDKRVIDALTKYFKYQLEELPHRPLDHYTFWANRRGGDNLQVVYWLYNITGDEFLLELAELLAEQTFPWTKIFLNEENYDAPESPWHYFKMKTYPFDEEEIDALTISQLGGMHCVNFAQGLKQPMVLFQQSKDSSHIKATKKALGDIQYYHGQPQGMYGGDEGLHGKNPVQGVEFCSISESMFSLETMLAISGDIQYADLLEKITFNALPTQASDNFMSRQYFQAANQVELSDGLETSYQTVDHHGTDFVFGQLTGYPCCTTNMHQSWPKFVQNLWYATPDNGVAALLYAPSSVSIKVGEGVMATITESTGYPFRDEIDFVVNIDKDAQFPFHLRIPDWCANPSVTINGNLWESTVSEGIVKINRSWSNGDVVKLKLPMTLKMSQWYDFAVAIERGPLTYALKIEEDRKLKDRGDKYGPFEEIHARSKWNYGLYFDDLDNLSDRFVIEEREWDGSYPWNLENAPIQIKARGVSLPEWKLANGLPTFPGWWGIRNVDPSKVPFEPITLVPYGTTTLRITEFPVYGMKWVSWSEGKRLGDK
ncbi:MAG: beta-L-arabinofuranosidase domain-containing protein [Bacteroidota bacterium]|nr:beta-L-arabinofuranosidase domain-containing protein [Bacteroidota bacterium]